MRPNPSADVPADRRVPSQASSAAVGIGHDGSLLHDAVADVVRRADSVLNEWPRAGALLVEWTRSQAAAQGPRAHLPPSSIPETSRRSAPYSVLVPHAPVRARRMMR